MALYGTYPFSWSTFYCITVRNNLGEWQKDCRYVLEETMLFMSKDGHEVDCCLVLKLWSFVVNCSIAMIQRLMTR